MKEDNSYLMFRKKYAETLNSMPLEKRVNFLVKKHKRNMQIAKQLNLNTISIKSGELNGKKQ